MIKTDFHTHSIASPDGSITSEQYRNLINSGVIDCVAVTDHNRIDFALKLQNDLGAEKVIVGEEIETTEGEIIGLFLTEKIAPHLSPEQTIEAIKAQNGIVYIPHPFETVRKGISRETLDRIKSNVDIIESANGRAFFQNFGPESHAWSHINRVASFASSDAHRSKSLCKTYSDLAEYPNRKNTLELCATARKHYSRPSMLDILAPKLNRIRKALKLL